MQKIILFAGFTALTFLAAPSVFSQVLTHGIQCDSNGNCTNVNDRAMQGAANKKAAQTPSESKPKLSSVSLCKILLNKLKDDAENQKQGFYKYRMGKDASSVTDCTGPRSGQGDVASIYTVGSDKVVQVKEGATKSDIVAVLTTSEDAIFELRKKGFKDKLMGGIAAAKKAIGNISGSSKGAAEASGEVSDDAPEVSIAPRDDE